MSPTIVAIVVLVITAAEAANVIATLFLSSGDPVIHGVFLSVAVGVGIASRPGRPAAPDQPGDAAQTAPDDDPPTEQRPAPRHRRSNDA